MFIPVTDKLSDHHDDRAFEASTLLYGKKLNPLKVYRKTGVFLHSDDLKVEISDKDAQLKVKSVGDLLNSIKVTKEGFINFNIKDFLLHDELFNNFNGIDDMTIVAKEKVSGDPLGSYSDKDLEITVRIDENTSLELLLETILHESQHGIQNKSGWNRGGSKGLFDNKTASAILETLSEEMNEHNLVSLQQLSNDYVRKCPGISSDIGLYIINASPHMLMINTAMEMKTLTDSDATAKYYSLFGEMEAFSIETKRKNTLEESMLDHPYGPFKNLFKHGIHCKVENDILFIIKDTLVKNLLKNALKEKTSSYDIV